MSERRTMWVCVIFALAALLSWRLGLISPGDSSVSRAMAPGYRVGSARQIFVRQGKQELLWQWAEGTWRSADGVGVGDALRIADLEQDLAMTDWLRRRFWHGLDPALGLHVPRATLAVSSATATKTWSLGSPVFEGGGVWVGDSVHAYLLTPAAAARLFVEPQDLRDRKPFRQISRAPIVTVAFDGQEVAFGNGQVIHGGHSYPMDPGADRTARSKLAALELVLFVDGAYDKSSRRIEARGDGMSQAFVAIGPGCGPGLWAATTSLGPGCVDATSVADLLASVAVSALVSRRMVPQGAPLESVQLDNGQTLAVTFENRATVDGWIRDLETQLGDFMGYQRARAHAKLLFRASEWTTAWTLAQTDSGLLAIRGTDPLGFVVPGRAAALFSPSMEFFARPSWADVNSEDVIAVRIRRKGGVAVSLVRGELLETWKNRGQAVPGGLIRTALSRLFPLRLTGPSRARRWDQTLEIEVQSALGHDVEVVVLQLALSECAIRRGGVGFVLAQDSCAALRELVRL